MSGGERVDDTPVHKAIREALANDVWYKASELVDVLGVRETRTKALLRALVEDGLLVDNGAIKGRKYKKK